MFVNETSSVHSIGLQVRAPAMLTNKKLGGDKRSSLLDRNLHNGLKKFHNVHEYLKKSSKLLTIFFKWGQGLIKNTLLTFYIGFL